MNERKDKPELRINGQVNPADEGSRIVYRDLNVSANSPMNKSGEPGPLYISLPQGRDATPAKGSPVHVSSGFLNVPGHPPNGGVIGEATPYRTDLRENDPDLWAAGLDDVDKMMDGIDSGDRDMLMKYAKQWHKLALAYGNEGNVLEYVKCLENASQIYAGLKVPGHLLFSRADFLFGKVEVSNVSKLILALGSC